MVEHYKARDFFANNEDRQKLLEQLNTDSNPDGHGWKALAVAIGHDDDITIDRVEKAGDAHPSLILAAELISTWDGTMWDLCQALAGGTRDFQGKHVRAVNVPVYEAVWSAWGAFDRDHVPPKSANKT